jgi:hypothetical protein
VDSPARSFTRNRSESCYESHEGDLTHFLSRALLPYPSPAPLSARSRGERDQGTSVDWESAEGMHSGAAPSRTEGAGATESLVDPRFYSQCGEDRGEQEKGDLRKQRGSRFVAARYRPALRLEIRRNRPSKTPVGSVVPRLPCITGTPVRSLRVLYGSFLNDTLEKPQRNGLGIFTAVISLNVCNGFTALKCKITNAHRSPYRFTTPRGDIYLIPPGQSRTREFEHPKLICPIGPIAPISLIVADPSALTGPDASPDA